MKRSLTILFIAISFTAIGQNTMQESSESDSLSIDDYYIDFAVPDLGAPALLGIQPEEIQKPGSVKEFASTITSFNQDGKLVNGMAMEWSPVSSFRKTFRPKDSISSVNRYRETYWWQQAIQITAATAIDSSGANLAVGIKWTPIDKTNPLLNKKFQAEIVQNIINNYNSETNDLSAKYSQERSKFIDSVLANFPDAISNNIVAKVKLSNLLEPGNSDEYPYPDPLTAEATLERFVDTLVVITGKKKMDVLTEEQRVTLSLLSSQFIAHITKKKEDVLGKSISEHKKKWLKENWNASVLNVAAGINLNSPDSTTSGLERRKFSMYTGYSIPLKSWGQLIFHGQFSKTLNISDSLSTIEDLSESEISGIDLQSYRIFTGGRLLAGTSNQRFSFEAAYLYVNNANEELNQSSFRYTLGIEFKVQDGLWFEIATGAINNVIGDKKVQPITFGKLKYALQKQRRYEIN